MCRSIQTTFPFSNGMYCAYQFKPCYRYIAWLNVVLISVSTSTKFLGIHIDENLSWKRHICQLNSKIARASFAINQVKNVLPKESLKTLYVALIQPHINYGILAWGNASLSTLNKTNILQKRILRTINKVKYNTHTDPLFRKSEILKLNDLYVYNILIFMFEYCQNKLPPSFQSMFMFNHEEN